MLLVRDETAERRIEEELRRNETRLDAVLEASANGVLVLSDDPARMVLMTNRALAEMFGLGVHDLLGASEDRLARLLHEAAPGAGAVVERILDRSASEEISVVSMGGEIPRELEVRVARLTGRRGEGLGRVVACRDVTAQRRSERELQEMADRLQLSKIELEQSYGKLREVNDELESRTETLDGMNRELRDLDTMKSDLIGNVSHELQTPLVSIRGYTEMILKERLGPISEEQRKGLGLSLKNIDRLIAMIDNLLAFSRTDPGLRDLRVSAFDLRPLVDESIALLAEKIEAKKLQVDVRIEGTGYAIRGDRDKILQVFLNLLSNAVNFGRDSGRITVTEGTAEKGHVAVSVEDDGVGIPEGALGRIFERHFQVRRGPGEPTTGSGIGLAIVRDILRLHGCTVDVESEEGRGTRFTFTLPLAPERAETSPSPVIEVEESGPEPPETPPSDPPDEPRPRLRIIRRYKP
jgi:PAS domain S-box-containing protein